MKSMVDRPEIFIMCHKTDMQSRKAGLTARNLFCTLEAALSSLKTAKLFDITFRGFKKHLDTHLQVPYSKRKAQHTRRPEPAGLDLRSHRLFILSTVAVGLFSDGFLYDLIVPAVPFMLEDDLNIPRSQVQAYISAMLAVFAGSTVISCPIAGLLADNVSSRRPPFLFALLCLLSATMVFFFGRSALVLLVARVIQGISSAFVWTVGLAMCIETVGASSMGRTIEAITSFTAMGSLWAPCIGGTLYRKAGLRGVAVVTVTVVAVDILLRLLMIEKRTPLAVEIDQTHADQEAYREEQPLFRDVKQDIDDLRLAPGQPLILRQVHILSCIVNSSLATAFFASLAQAMLMGAFDSTIAVIAHELFEFDSFQAGLLFLPIGIMNLVCGPIVGWIIDRYGTKIIAVCSFGIMVPMLVLLRSVGSGDLPQVMFYAGLLTFAGVGLAGAVIERYHKANPGSFGQRGPYAMVYGINGMVSHAGLTIGPELAGCLKDRIGYGNMNLVLAVVPGATAILCYVFLGDKLFWLTQKCSQRESRE